MKSIPCIPTTRTPNDPNKLYFFIMYQSFFFGPFATEEELVEAMKRLDAWDNMWDYDCFGIVYGANPLPKDLAFGLPFVDKDMRDRIIANRCCSVNERFKNWFVEKEQD